MWITRINSTFPYCGFPLFCFYYFKYDISYWGTFRYHIFEALTTNPISYARRIFNNRYVFNLAQDSHIQTNHIAVFSKLSILLNNKVSYIQIKFNHNLTKVEARYIGRWIYFRVQRSGRNQPPLSDDRGFVSWSCVAPEGHGGVTGMAVWLLFILSVIIVCVTEAMWRPIRD